MDADVIIGHNIIDFDIPALTKVYPELVLKAEVIDTLVDSRLIWTNLKDKDFDFARKTPAFTGNLIGSHSLEAWGLRLGFPKDDYSKRMKEKGADPWAEWNPLMQEYCEQDVAVNYEFFKMIEKKNYSKQARRLEHEFKHVIRQQEVFGFPFKEKEAAKLYSVLAQKRMAMEEELRSVFAPWWRKVGKTIVASRDVKYFRADPRGSKERRVKKKGQDAYFEQGYYEYHEKGAERCKIELVTFNPGSRDHISNRLQKLYGWKPKDFSESGKPTIDEEVISALPYPEAKILGEYLMVQKRIGQLAEGANAWLKLVKPDGRIHGRVITNGAVTGRCTHMKPNVAQTPSIANAKGIVPYGKECRELFYAPEGWALVGADASGLELRCLAHYMAKWDNGSYTDVILNGDIHTVNQKAAGLPTRSNAKTFIYGFLYGGGDAKIGEIVGKGAKAGAALKRQFLNRTPALKMLRDKVQDAVKKRGYLVGLDGRLLHIRSPHSALNTLLQSAGALAVKQATVFLYQDLSAKGYIFGEHYALVAHVHDEVQILVKKELADEVGRTAVEAFRKAGEHFGFRCPLDGEYKVGTSWADTH